MRINIVTMFPQMFQTVTDYGVTGKANRSGVVEINPVDLRSFGIGSHQVLDDRPFGGGPGMVMMAQPVIDCVEKIKDQASQDVQTVYLSPQGKRLEHRHVYDFSKCSELILLCGRYEGIDQRALDIIDAQEWSIGDYVLSGGELAAMVLIDAVVRQVPGVLGNEQSKAEDSFANGLLDCIHYTRPHTVQGMSVPEVLVSGDHNAIRRWRLRQSVGRTWLKRPDLLEKIELDEHARRVLYEFQSENEELESS